MIIGIMGKVGSGKSLCVKFIKDNYDAKVFICDDISKEMIKNREIIFDVGNPKDFFVDKKIQEKCRKEVHPKVFDKISKILLKENKKNKENGIDKIFVIETALPGEVFFEVCDKVICIENDYVKKKEILNKTRNYSDELVELIYNSQKYYDKYYRMADYNILNNGTKEELLNKISEVMNEICIICK